MRWWRRLQRILGQDRIRLPRRPLQPIDLVVGDRLQIGLEVWRVSGARTVSAASCERKFDLVLASACGSTARLITTPSAGEVRPWTWILVRGGDRLEIPPEMIITFPSGLVRTQYKERTRS